MSDIIKDPVLVSAIQDLARGIKSEADLSSLTRELLKITVEASLNAEMEAHLGYPKHSPTGHHSVTIWSRPHATPICLSSWKN